jgi:hypothetical protein
MDHSSTFTTVALLTVTMTFVFVLTQTRRGLHTPRLKGPPTQNFLYGVTEQLFNSPNHGAIYQAWERTFGSVYEIPSSLGSRIVVLSDPKAAAHVFMRDTSTYHQLKLAKAISRQIVGFHAILQKTLTHSYDPSLVTFW